MDQNLPHRQMSGFLFTAVLGTFLHFFFDLTGGSVVAALISAVNESIFEHMKLIYYPMLLFALLQPNEELKTLQDSGNFSKLMAMQEELKTLPFGEVWNEYCKRCDRPVDGAWYPEIEAYEKEVLEARK